MPELLDVPTGCGKTATAVLGWLWRRRFAADAVRSTTPRRLIYCLPTRVLVEQTADAIERWLKAAAGSPAIAVYRLLGGEVAGDWDTHPEREAVLVGTQDQLLSRALNRGYAMSRYRWPMHFALVNNDCLWVMDEVQLMGPGLPTTAQLQAFRESFGVAGTSRSLWMSATLDADALQTFDFSERAKSLQRQSLGPEDRKHEVLAQRLTARKPITASAVTLASKSYPRDLAREVLAAHRPGTLSLVVVNRVRRAQAVFAEIDKTRKTGTLLVHSRFRPWERVRLNRQLLDLPPDAIVVATQAIEAGVDISACTLFTELAPWSSLVQRFGRCNRRGEYPAERIAAAVHWVDAPADGDHAPYEESDLKVARDLLHGLSDVGPRSLSKVEYRAPVRVLQTLRRRDFLGLFDTTPDVSGLDIDVSRYIRDSVDRDVSVFWRTWVEDDPPSTEPGATPQELCSVPIEQAREFVTSHGGWKWDAVGGRWQSIRPRDHLLPGMMVLLRADDGGYDANLGWTGERATGPVPIPPRVDTARVPEWLGSDPDSALGTLVSLRQHSDDIVREVKALAAQFGEYRIEWTTLEQAARWHDAGKAHFVFQNALLSDSPEGDPERAGGPYAKGRRRNFRYERPRFRHELASTLALLNAGGSDLAAYLVVSHHGKIRMSIRSYPEEARPGDARKFAAGVWDQDSLGVVDLGGGVVVSDQPLSLDIMILGGGGSGMGWNERALRLRDQHGPFVLALMETLLRIADWRASAVESKGVDRG